MPPGQDDDGAPARRPAGDAAAHAPSEAEVLALRLHDLSSRPFAAMGNWLRFHLLRLLSGRASPLDPDMKARLARSARKRDPARYLAIAEAERRRDPARPVPRPVAVRAPEFLPFDPPAARPEPDVRLIAFYLPQFHPFAENDLWWGKGFTEWTNVGKARPLFDGHYQPHCPIHLGYYDLRIPSVMEEQARIARAYGVGGFNYYFYWFGGKTLMEAPLRSMLANPAVDMPFFLTWANENWTRRWDGAEHDVLIGQNHSRADTADFLRHVAGYLKDPRYIRIDGRPVLAVYRANLIPEIAAMTAVLRDEARALGLKDLYLLSVETFGRKDPRPMGFDAAIEFPPLDRGAPRDPAAVPGLVPGFSGRVHDYPAVVTQALAEPAPAYPRFRGAMLSWDNSARKGDRADVFADFSLAEYRRWLAALVADARRNADPDKRIVFINAWNEWAEGTHLEPDQRYGFAYLQATYDALTRGRTG